MSPNMFGIATDQLLPVPYHVITLAEDTSHVLEGFNDFEVIHGESR